MADEVGKSLIIQQRYADHSGYYTGRRNGWIQYPLIFDRSVSNTITSSIPSDTLFSYGTATGSIDIIRPCRLNIELWWQGHAPFRTKDVWVYKNLRDLSNFHEEHDLMCLQGKSPERQAAEQRWQSKDGHLVVETTAEPGSVYHVTNIPAQIQGAPAVFSLSITATSGTADSTSADYAHEQSLLSRIRDNFTAEGLDSIHPMLLGLDPSVLAACSILLWTMV